MPVDIVVGGQAGDEGKGKIGAYLAHKNDYDYAIRVGGPNAGHTVFYEGSIYALKTMPAGFVNKRTKLVLGAGTYVIPEWLEKEIKLTGAERRLIIDPHVVVIEPRHTSSERADARLMGKIGSVGTGLGAAVRDRIDRKKLMFAKDHPRLKKYVKDVPELLNKALAKGSKMLLEGTQGMKLSVLHGEYPFVTSRDTTASTFMGEAGLGPKYAGDVYAVFKPYVTRVGPGLVSKELKDKKALNKYHTAGREVGSVSGRLRRVGEFELDVARMTVRINSATKLAITHIDLLDGADISRGIKSFTGGAKKFLSTLEQVCAVYPYPKVKLVSYGPGLMDVLEL
ncbi:MAG: adenylosuccinate synthetase [Elusimicrobia bacterium CG08_land_8_20_14_0_20_59_10]|nr:MAG: adenylosuccinate synthetase [Elusimicrobia bacterium CG08_land_8_20_14_0_20_59_10]